MNIYISNLDQSMTEQDVKKLFEQYGEVSSVKVVTDYNTGNSRGFAFVEMSNDREATKAINRLNNTEWSGRTLLVEIARPKEENPKKGSYSGRESYT